MTALALPLTALALALTAAWTCAASLWVAWRLLPPRLRGAWLTPALALPALAALTVGLAALVPGDPHLDQLLSCHCAESMPSWAHLCPVHPQSALPLLPGALLLLALLLPGRLRALWALSSEPLGRGGVDVPALVELPRPTALLVGWWRPSLVVDRRLWAELTAPQREAVLAHERAHAAQRDPLALMLLRGLAALGPRWATRDLLRAWVMDAELRADAAAAEVLGDPMLVAEALLRCARMGSPGAAHALGWTGAALDTRIYALLNGAAPPKLSYRRTAALLALCGLAALAASPTLHHQLEHLLNSSL